MWLISVAAKAAAMHAVYVWAVISSFNKEHTALCKTAIHHLDEWLPNGSDVPCGLSVSNTHNLPHQQSAVSANPSEQAEHVGHTILRLHIPQSQPMTPHHQYQAIFW